MSNSSKSASNYSQSTIDIQDKARFHSLIAIGSPIVDIYGEVNKETAKQYDIDLDKLIHVDQKNIDEYIKNISITPHVTIIPGGAIQNTLKVCSWCLNMEPNGLKNYTLTMLGATGEDEDRKRIEKALKIIEVKPLFEKIPKKITSRCGIIINQKKKYLLPEIKASNCLNKNFVTKNLDEILKNEILLIEGYFLKEKSDICEYLCDEFQKQKKYIILTLSSVSIIKDCKPHILKIANNANMIVGNMEEFQALALDIKDKEIEKVFENVFAQLNKKDRLIVATDGSKGAFVSKYDYQYKKLEFISHSYPRKLKLEEIKDLNGAGDAFLGGFLSQFMKGRSLYSCCKAGNDVANEVLHHIGCTFPEKKKITFGL